MNFRLFPWESRRKEPSVWGRRGHNLKRETLKVHSRQMQVSEEEGSEKGPRGTLISELREHEGGGCSEDSEGTRGAPLGAGWDLWGEVWPMSP